jgi:hypothetical protein
LLSISLNLGYRYYSQHLPEKTWPVYRDEEFMAANADRRVEVDAIGRGNCSTAVAVV